jgi:hypothetical protein
MPRYGPPPEPPDEPPVALDESSLTRWSPGRKALAILASGAMVAAFVFNFVPRSTPRKRVSPTTTRPAPTTSTSTSTSTTTTSTSTTSTTVLRSRRTPTTL